MNPSQEMHERLSRAERMVELAIACLELQSHAAWKVIEDVCRAEIDHYVRTLLHEPVSIEQVHELRGCVKALRFLMDLPKNRAARLPDLRREIQDLRNKLAARQNLDLDKDAPGIREFLDDIHKGLRL